MTARGIVRIGIVVAVSACVILIGRVALQAFNPQPDPPKLFYGPMTIMPGETVRLYVANVADPAGPAGAPSPDDTLELSIFDEAGGVQAQVVEMVAPGRTVFLEITPRIASLLRAEVRLVRGRAPFVSSLEVFGDGMVSRFVHPLSLVGFNPQPDPPKGGKR